MSEDRSFMRLALRLGRKGLGRTSPNPPVGAVVVARRRVVGRGLHRRAGAPHAEIEALREAGRRSRGATLYVTLEPCNHHGRTPPCTEAVLEAGIRRVVIGTRDPNPDVRGRGAERLRRAGIEVLEGVEGAASAELIAPFACRVRTGRPLVTLKLAASLDGKIATRNRASRWITGEAARRLVHRWRNEVDAVMVGAGTVRADDPQLTCRIRGGRDPLRVIVDGRLRVPLGARVVTSEAARGTLVASVSVRQAKMKRLRERGVTVLALPGQNGVLSIGGLLEELARRGVSSVLIEGGAALAAAALREKVVDRLRLFMAPKLIGGDGRAMIDALGVLDPAEALPLYDVGVSRVGDEVLLRANLRSPHAI